MLNLIEWYNKEFSSETSKHSLVRFLILLVILSGYFFAVVLQFGLSDGFLIMLLTWSFFVFCTPIADAGFLLDFPLRLLFKIRMVYSELIVWGIALFVNIFAWLFVPTVYGKTFILSLFHHIISQPFPYWGILILSGAGTFLSVIFGDELMDVVLHSERVKHHSLSLKFQVIFMIGILALILILYDFLLNKLGINLHL